MRLTPAKAIDITPPTRIAIVNAISDRSQVQFSNGSPTFLTGSFLTCSYPWWPVRVVSDGGRTLVGGISGFGRVMSTAVGSGRWLRAGRRRCAQLGLRRRYRAAGRRVQSRADNGSVRLPLPGLGAVRGCRHRRRRHHPAPQPQPATAPSVRDALHAAG